MPFNALLTLLSALSNILSNKPSALPPDFFAFRLPSNILFNAKHATNVPHFPKIKEEIANEFLIEHDIIAPSNFMKEKSGATDNDSKENRLDTSNENHFLPALWLLEPRIFAMENGILQIKTGR